MRWALTILANIQTHKHNTNAQAQKTVKRLKLAVTQQARQCAVHCVERPVLKDLYLLWCSPPRRSFIANISRSFGRRWTCQKVPARGQAPLWAFQKTDNHLYDHHHHHFLCSNIAITFRIAIYCRFYVDCRTRSLFFPTDNWMQLKGKPNGSIFSILIKIVSAAVPGLIWNRLAD